MPDIFDDADTSKARPRKQFSPEERAEMRVKREESKSRHGLYSVDTWPGTPQQWKELLQGASPTHQKWAMDLHKAIKDAGYPLGLATPPGQLKTPGIQEAIQTLLKHTMSHEMGRHDPESQRVREKPAMPGDEFFKAPAGVGPKGGALEPPPGGDLKQFSDVMPLLGGRPDTAEVEDAAEAMGGGAPA